jgi:hypothetical protein
MHGIKLVYRIQFARELADEKSMPGGTWEIISYAPVQRSVPHAAAARPSTAGASSLYITGVTSRARMVDEISPPMITQARGE